MGERSGVLAHSAVCNVSVGEPTDEDLVAELRGGRVPAFDRLYERYERRLFAYVFRTVGDRSLAEDLFQDVFYTVLVDRSFDPARGRFAPWLFTVARNRCRMHARRAGQAPPQPIETPSEADLGLSSDATSVVRTAMAGLSHDHQELIVLKQLGELSYREIAQLQGEHEGTIKSRLHAAMKALRRRMAEIGEEG